MSGHSKWASIKRKKAANDHARGKLFSRHAREITVAAREGGGDSELNPRLRLAVQKARGDAMPNDNIERAIKKGTGELEGGSSYDSVLYEGYGPHGVALMIDTLTDNRNRTVGELRATFNKHGGSLGESGCVAYQFETKGLIQVDRAGRDEDEVLEAALEAGAEDLKSLQDSYEVVCAAEELHSVVENLQQRGLSIGEYDITRVPTHVVRLEEAGARQVLRLMDALEDCEDVQKVYGNFDIDESVMETLGAEG